MTKRQELVEIPKEIVLKVLTFLGEVAYTNQAARGVYNVLQDAFTSGLKFAPIARKEPSKPKSRKICHDQLDAIDNLVSEVAAQNGFDFDEAETAGKKIVSLISSHCGGFNIYFPLSPESLPWVKELEDLP